METGLGILRHQETVFDGELTVRIELVECIGIPQSECATYRIDVTIEIEHDAVMRQLSRENIPDEIEIAERGGVPGTGNIELANVRVVSTQRVAKIELSVIVEDILFEPNIEFQEIIHHVRLKLYCLSVNNGIVAVVCRETS